MDYRSLKPENLVAIRDLPLFLERTGYRLDRRSGPDTMSEVETCV